MRSDGTREALRGSVEVSRSGLAKRVKHLVRSDEDPRSREAIKVRLTPGPDALRKCRARSDGTREAPRGSVEVSRSD